MYFSRSVMATAIMGFATAQANVMASEAMMASATGSAAASMSTSTEATAGMINTHVVQVGGSNGSLVFSPSNVVAQPGDMVQFQFHPKNHSVVQSTFDAPCVPMANAVAAAANNTTGTAAATAGFFSGFMPTNASFGTTANVLTFTVPVKDTKPIWFYCSQGMHCQAGMVGAINAPASGNKTMAAFAALAAQAPENLSPGQAPGAAGGAGGAGGATPPSGTNGGAGGAGNLPPSPSVSTPAQQTANAASSLSGQSFFGLGAAAVVAFAML